MSDIRKTGEDVFAGFSSKVLEERVSEVSAQFAVELRDIAMENVFSKLWTRPGLDQRSRSLVTLGILIALRATDEFKLHSIIGLRNGLTIAELEEVIYHSTGYAGFPAATAAVAAATEALRKEGLIS